MSLNVLKISFLFIAIWLSIVNISRVSGKESVSAKQFIYQALAITGFLAIQFNLY